MFSKRNCISEHVWSMHSISYVIKIKVSQEDVGPTFFCYHWQLDIDLDGSKIKIQLRFWDDGYIHNNLKLCWLVGCLTDLSWEDKDTLNLIPVLNHLKVWHETELLNSLEWPWVVQQWLNMNGKTIKTNYQSLILNNFHSL